MISLSDTLIKCEKVEEVLNLAYAQNKNVVLYGRGGHAKSLAATTFLEKAGETPYIKALGQGTLIEDLLGGMDMKEFKDSGKIIYNLENSFMNHEYVILEEGFDAPVQVLEQLKDVLMSGVFRNGHQTFTIKTKMIIVCTNRSADELGQDASTKALMERFPLRHKMEWSSYRPEDYSALISKVMKKKDEHFAYLISEISKRVFISPRQAIIAYEVYCDLGLMGLEHLGINPSILQEFKELEEKRSRLEAQRNYLDTCLNKLETYKIKAKKTPKNTIKEVQKIIDNMRQHSYDDETYDTFKNYTMYAEGIIEKALNVIKYET